MKRCAAIALCALALSLGHAAPARADLTAFYGVSPDPSSRSTTGVSIGLSLLVVGFEFEYGKIVEDEPTGSPALTTGMGNIVFVTPTTKLQLYATTGGGVFREQWRDFTTTNFATNVGGGIKLALFGPIRLRVDYRVFTLKGTPLVKHVQRVYGGINLSF
jgi:hypothetical protein